MMLIGCSEIWRQAPHLGKTYDELQSQLAAEGWFYNINIDAWQKRTEEDESP